MKRWENRKASCFHVVQKCKMGRNMLNENLSWKLEQVLKSMKWITGRRNAELDSIKNSKKKYRTQLKKKLEEEVQNSMNYKTRRENTELNEIKNWKNKYKTRLNKKFEEVG